MTPKKLTIDADELSMAKLAGEIRVPFKVTVRPSRIPKPRVPKRVIKRKRMGVQVVGGKLHPRKIQMNINPLDALTRFDVTIKAQALDVQLKQIYEGVFIQNIDGAINEAKHQMDWAIVNRLRELKMKMEWSVEHRVDISSL